MWNKCCKMRMILWYWHLDQPIWTEITLSLKEINRLLRYKLCQQQEQLHQVWELPWWIKPCRVWCWANTHLHTIPPGPESWRRWGRADACKGDAAAYEETKGQRGQCGGSDLCFAEFSVRKGERWRMRRMMLWGLYGDTEQKGRAVGELERELARWCWWEGKSWWWSHPTPFLTSPLFKKITNTFGGDELFCPILWPPCSVKFMACSCLHPDLPVRPTLHMQHSWVVWSDVRLVQP